MYHYPEPTSRTNAITGSKISVEKSQLSKRSATVGSDSLRNIQDKITRHRLLDKLSLVMSTMSDQDPIITAVIRSALIVSCLKHSARRGRTPVLRALVVDYPHTRSIEL